MESGSGFALGWRWVDGGPERMGEGSEVRPNRLGPGACIPLSRPIPTLPLLAEVGPLRSRAVVAAGAWLRLRRKTRRQLHRPGKRTALPNHNDPSCRVQKCSGQLAGRRCCCWTKVISDWSGVAFIFTGTRWGGVSKHLQGGGGKRFATPRAARRGT